MAVKDALIISSLCGKGLEREYLLLKDILESRDVYVTGRHYTDFSGPYHPQDFVVFLEVLHPAALNLSRNNYLIPNSEWWHAGNDQYLNRITKVLCKTQDCYRIWSQKVGEHKCVYTGFESRDLFRPEVSREVKFLHVAGQSEFKNTEAVIQAWQKTNLSAPPLPPLVVVTTQPRFIDLCKLNPHGNITCLSSRVSEEDLIQLMNSHRIHLIPSMYEGFGHVIHEALGCEGLVITTDAAPMNSYEGALREFLVPSSGSKPRSLAQLHTVSPDSVHSTARELCLRVWNKPEWVKEHSELARAAFLRNRDKFRASFLQAVGVA